MHSSVLAGVGTVRAENPPRPHSTAWPATLILIGANSRRVYEGQVKRRDGVKVDLLKPSRKLFESYNAVGIPLAFALVKPFPHCISIFCAREVKPAQSGGMFDAAVIWVGTARFLGIVCPILFAGVTIQYSFILVDPIVTHAPNEKVMAKLWLHAYQLGPYWVPPLILPGTLANAYLAYLSPVASWQRLCYVSAAGGIFSILVPITFFIMEPGINGACKWKVQSLLKDEDFSMPKTTIWKPSAHKHGGTQKSRRWAERTSMKELVLYWRWMNDFRWALGGVAGLASGWATFSSV